MIIGMTSVADVLWAACCISSLLLTTVVAVRNIRQALREKDYDPIPHWMESVYPKLMWLAIPIGSLQVIEVFHRLSATRVFMIGLLGLCILFGLMAKRMESKQESSKPAT